MYFETAGIEVSVWIPPLVAFVVSLFTSMGGVSGAFLLMPFQMSVLGYATPSVSATNQLFNVVAIPSGVYRYVKEGRMVWPLAWAVIIGTLPGVILGAIIRVKYLPDPTNFKIFAGLVLAYIGLRMARDIWKQKIKQTEALDKSHNQKNIGTSANTKVTLLNCTATSISYEFSGDVYHCSRITIFIMSLVVGIVGGVYGIGGGAIVAPFFVSICGLPVYTVAGAALMGTLVTSVIGVAFYQILSSFYSAQSIAPDWILGILFGIGGTFGMYCGARLQKYVPAIYIKSMLCLIIFGTALSYIKYIFK
jgi:uncharacterized membrane protein YfcA